MKYMLLDINQFDLSDCESSDHYQRFEDVRLPEDIHVYAEITSEDLAYGLANARPIAQ